jgi:hypothetical protein
MSDDTLAAALTQLQQVQKLLSLLPLCTSYCLQTVSQLLTMSSTVLSSSILMLMA